MVPKQRGILRICKDGNVEELQALLQSNPELATSAFVHGNTPLHFAGNREIARLLVQFGADLHCTNDFKETPLLTAVWDERLDVVEYLLEQGAEVNHQDYKGDSALHIAVMLGNEELVELLLSKGADANLYDHDEDDEFDDMVEAPLFDAVRNGNISMISLLLKHGANPNQKNYYSDTPLHYAVKKSKEATECLLKHGADPNIPGPEEKTPLHYAKDKEVVSLLLAYGANPIENSEKKNTEISLPDFHEQFQRYLDYFDDDCCTIGYAILRPIYRLHPVRNEIVAPLPGGLLGKIVFAPQPKVSQWISLDQETFYDLAISPDGTKIAITASNIEDVEIRNFEDFSLIERLRLPEHIHKEMLFCVAFSPDGEYLAVGPYLYHFASRSWEPLCDLFRFEPIRPSVCTFLPGAEHIVYSCCENLVSYHWKDRSYLEKKVDAYERAIVDLTCSEDGNAVAFFEALREPRWIELLSGKLSFGNIGLYLPKENQMKWRVNVDNTVFNLPDSLKKLDQKDFPKCYAGKVLIAEDTVVATLPYGNLIFLDEQTGEIIDIRTLNTNTILALGKSDLPGKIRIATDREIVTMELTR